MSSDHKESLKRKIDYESDQSTHSSTFLEPPTNTNEEEDEVHSLLDFADGIKYLIFSFAYESILHEHSPVPNLIANLFQSFGFTSKECYNICIRYIQHTPMQVGGIQEDGPALEAFVSRTRVKIHSIDINLHSTVTVALSIHILRCCDLSELHNLYISEIKSEQTDDELVNKCYSAGIPRECIEEFASTPYTTVTIQTLIADILRERAPNLKRLEISIKKEEWHQPLLASLSNRLTYLALQLSWADVGLSFPYDDQAKAITEVIKGMTQLKSLRLQIVSFLGGSFEIESQSLEIIDTRPSRNLFLTRCTCPSLKTFLCSLKASNMLLRNGLEVGNASARDILSDSSDNECTELRVGDHLFTGLDAPRDCIVKVY
jgi:hypothetical protein